MLVNNLIEYISEYQKICNRSDKVYFFRGSSNYNYEEVPSIFRNINIEEKTIIENILIEEPNEFKGLNITSVLVKLQHYGIPTRLLDITLNPLMAFYFACENNSNCNGKVNIYEVGREEILTQNSDKAFMLATLSKMRKDEQKELMSFFENNKNSIITENVAKSNSVVYNYYHEIQKQDNSFLFRIEASDLLKHYYFMPYKDHQRIRMQSGAFIIFTGYAGYKTTNFKSSEIIINKECKENILKELKQIQISISTVYPELDERCREIRKSGNNWHNLF